MMKDIEIKNFTIGVVGDTDLFKEYLSLFKKKQYIQKRNNLADLNFPLINLDDKNKSKENWIVSDLKNKETSKPDDTKVAGSSKLLMRIRNLFSYFRKQKKEETENSKKSIKTIHKEICLEMYSLSPISSEKSTC